MDAIESKGFFGRSLSAGGATLPLCHTVTARQRVIPGGIFDARSEPYPVWTRLQQYTTLHAALSYSEKLDGETPPQEGKLTVISPFPLTKPSYAYGVR
jgi:hypothetical protein